MFPENRPRLHGSVRGQLRREGRQRNGHLRDVRTRAQRGAFRVYNALQHTLLEEGPRVLQAQRQLLGDAYFKPDGNQIHAHMIGKKH